MYKQAKYIVGEVPTESGMPQLIALVFPETIAHSDMKHVFVHGTIHSAGFCSCQNPLNPMPSVWGESKSLEVRCDPKLDERLVGRAMGHPAYVT